MSLRPEAIGPVPDETARVARAAFSKGNVHIQMRDVLGIVYDDATFAPLFSSRGRPAEAPWRLALVTIMQFAEGLSDRQAAEAVRTRIDWKTETCDDDLPHLLTQVETTIAPATELDQLAVIQAALARNGYLPAEHLVDAGYVRGRNLAMSYADHQIELVGPIDEDRQGQATAQQGFDVAQFRIDWDARACAGARPRRPGDGR